MVDREWWTHIPLIAGKLKAFFYMYDTYYLKYNLTFYKIL